MSSAPSIAPAPGSGAPAAVPAAAPAPSGPSGPTIHAAPDTLSFDVNDVQNLGHHGDREYYRITVTFREQGTTAVFQSKSKSLKTALKMIEAFGQQTHNLTPVKFKEQFNKLQGKRIWFDLTKTIDDQGRKQHRAIGYKLDRHENLKNAFSSARKGFTQPILTLTDSIMQQLKNKAAHHRTQPLPPLTSSAVVSLVRD